MKRWSGRPGKPLPATSVPIGGSRPNIQSPTPTWLWSWRFRTWIAVGSYRVPGAQIIEIENQLDVELAKFGGETAALLEKALRDCGVSADAELSEVLYQDPYVCSPLVARMLLDVVSSLVQRVGPSEPSLTIQTHPPRDDERQPWQIGHDWRDATVQRATIELLARARGLRASVEHTAVPHGRYMHLKFKNGTRARLIFDQGFGAWAPPRQLKVRFDFSMDPQSQSSRLENFNVLLERRGLGKTYVVALSED